MTRPKRVDQEREDVRIAREKARRAVSYWESGRCGSGKDVHQEMFFSLLGRDLGDVVKRYPQAIQTDGKRNLWDMEILSSILLFDDPVTMLVNMPDDSPSTKSAMIRELEREGCSRAQEEALRNSFLAMLNQRPYTDSDSDPWVIAFRLFKENSIKAKK